MNKIIAIMCLSVFVLIGCNVQRRASTAPDAVQRRQTEQSMKEANSQIGMPAIKNFQERKLAKMIFELRDQENYVCYAYIVNLNGDLVFLGKCLGYGLPYSVQFTNPERLVDSDIELDINTFQDSGRVQTLPQPDPNGLFMPEGLSATWLMMLDEKGDARPVYVEPEIIVSPIKLHKD